MTVTADTITDKQIYDLLASAIGSTVEAHIRALHDLALAATEEARIVLALKPGQRRQARARCAELLNRRAQERCNARRHEAHVRDVCEGQCCMSCGGPIDQNEECRC